MENVMVLFLAFEFEEVSGRLARKLGLFLELAKRCGREVFAALEDASRQSPFRLSRNEKNSFALSTDDSGAFLQNSNSTLLF